jgi:hypothetical protein
MSIESERLLTEADIAKLCSVGRSKAYQIMKSIPDHVVIGTGPRPMLRVPMWGFQRWTEAGGDKSACENYSESKAAHIGIAKDETGTEIHTAALPNKRMKPRPAKLPNESQPKNLFPRLITTRSMTRAQRS